MVWFLLIFIVIDIIQTLYIRHLKKELAFRDGEEADKGSFLDLTRKGLPKQSEKMWFSR